MSQYIPEMKSSKRVKVELDLSNHVTKADFKNAAGLGISKFAKKVDLADIVVKKTLMFLKKMYIMLRSKILKLKYLILLT